MATKVLAEKTSVEVADEAIDGIYKIAALTRGALALLDEHGGAGTDDKLCLVWHSLRGVIDLANSLAEEISE